MFQNVLMDPKLSKEKQVSRNFFNVFWKLYVLSKKKIWIFVSFQFHTHILQVISYKRKYVLLHLNMLRLFQKINILFSLRLS
jgi:hypothetical protein